ncbi:PLAC8-domain-containing protein [Hypoxylon trugodes]|uniref:PLAC8-domain-containing protein n=1 Tax=Hypoxylon trugodes TaxID=326681 RepID=UPI0021A17674|nr:PLAC8-domain-containing protein [Hypoxylon trugodes]KAI1386779.1 PLAC8-domain-containing protein [Hypoxylon trugodes]
MEKAAQNPPGYAQATQPQPEPQPQYQQPIQDQPPAGAYTDHPHPHPHPHSHAHMHAPSAYGQQGGEWQASLCDCSPCTSCLLAWCLPCLLLGQTSERIRDPSMQTADMMNSDCMIHGLINCFTGCGWIYGMMKRSEIRERYKIEGSGCNDCCVSFWCSCCALIQQDNEVKIRQRNAQPVDQGYQSQPAMQVPVPAPAPAYQP